MSITFGSFGDIIAAVQVACKLIEVLDAQKGAKREFRDVIVDLRLFHRFLDQLLSFWQTRKEGPLLANLYDILQPAIQDSKEEISSVLERIISRYGRSLTSSKRNPKDIGKMLQWQMLEHDEIARLQEKLQKSKELILMVQSQAMMIAEEQNRALVAEKTSALMDTESEVMAELNERLDRLETKAEEQFEMLRLIYNSIGNISSAIDPIVSAASNNSTMLAKIHTQLLDQGMMYRTLNPDRHNSALVEDALGWTHRIPLDLIGSWNTVHSILLDKFANQPGYLLVKQRRYVMRDDLNGMELRQDVPLHSVLRPGQKVNMCMVYFSGKQHLMACPRCKQSTLCTTNSDITCLNPKCGMEIQRIEEIVEDPTITEVTGNTSDGISESEADFDGTIPVDLVRPYQIEDGLEVFKRIRLLSRWEFREESRGPQLYQTGQDYWWLADGPEPFAIRDSIMDLVAPALRKRFVFNRRRVSFYKQIYFAVYFVGPSIQQSRPVLAIFSMEEARRKAALRYCKGIDWIKAHPSIILLTTCDSMFHPSIKRIFGEK